MLFGIEIETVGKTRNEIAQKILKGNRINYVKVKCEKEPEVEYDIVLIGNHTFWKIEDDTSLRYYPREERGEVVSPILDETEIDILKNVVSTMKEIGVKTSKKCGVHVHINAKEATIENMCNLINIMIQEEEKLIEIFQCNKERINKYAKKLNQDFIDAFRKNIPVTKEDLSKLWYSDNSSRKSKDDRYHPSRYRGLNLHSYFFRKSVEFRYFDSSIEPDKIVNYVNYCINIAKKAGIK